MYYLVNEMYQRAYHSIDIKNQNITVAMDYDNGMYIAYHSFNSLAEMFERYSSILIDGKESYYIVKTLGATQNNNVLKIEKIYTPVEVKELFSKLTILL